MPKTPSDPSATIATPMILTVAQLRAKGMREFDLRPDATALRALQTELGLDGLRKLRFVGKITPEGAGDLRLEAQLGATLTQACRLSLAPVVTRIDEPVLRRYLQDVTLPDAGEVEMPEDDTIEPLPAKIDLWAVMVEALALSVPDYPLAPEMGNEAPMVFVAAPKGAQIDAPPADAPTRPKPFAALADLAKRPSASDSDPEA